LSTGSNGLGVASLPQTGTAGVTGSYRLQVAAVTLVASLLAAFFRFKGGEKRTGEGV
jgi:hypothetical protein